jgi:putative effector of murein hydrolase LrgA (UPF0299 family)
MLYTFAILLIFQCLGEASVLVLGLNIPGAVVGMLLLFFALLASPRLMEKMEESSHHVLKHMSLFFIPAGVGIMVSASLISQHWIALLIAIVASTLLTLAVTALSMRYLMPAHPSPSDQSSDASKTPKPPTQSEK